VHPTERPTLARWTDGPPPLSGGARPGGPTSGVRRSAFWAAVLTGDPEGELVPLGDRWRPLRHPTDTPGSWHLDLWLTPDVAASRIEAALSAGGRVVDDSAHPSYTVLADLHGNLACIGTVLRDEPPLPG
jgi:hypothetical protein